MSDWKLIELHESEELAELRHFSFKRKQGDREIEFNITVREFSNPSLGAMRFFARSNKQTNQELAPYTPSGWGNDIMSARADCLRAIRKFPYQGD